MYRSGLVDTLVTHANMKGLGLTPLFRDRRGFMPPQLKTKLFRKFVKTCHELDLNGWGLGQTGTGNGFHLHNIISLLANIRILNGNFCFNGFRIAHLDFDVDQL